MTPDELQALSDRTSDLLALADVKRWGVVKTLRQQSVAEHCFAVAAIAMELSGRLLEGRFDQFTGSQILVWSLVHDVPEVLTSDIDGKFKRDNPEFRAALVAAENKAFPWYAAIAHTLNDRALWIVKTADKIESIAFIQMWGKGPRADDVYQELVSILHNEVTPKLAEAVGMPLYEVEFHVRDVLHHSTSEVNSIQLRRHRAPK